MKKINWNTNSLEKLPKTRAAAIDIDSKYYFSGKKCKGGHISARETRRSICVECRREGDKKSAEKRRRRIGMNIQKLVQPLESGEKSNKLTATGNIKRERIKSKKRTYTTAYHEVICDCGNKFWIANACWGTQIQCVKCHTSEISKKGLIERQKSTFIENDKSQTLEASLLYAARNRARRGNMDFDLCLEDIVIPEYCPALAVKLDKTIRKKTRSLGTKGSRKPRYNAPSIDRIDSNLGYTKDNIKIISYRANVLKKDGSALEHLKVAEFLEKLLSE